MVATEFSIRADDGVILSGTATLPSNPRAIIIPLHGSFVQTRDGDLDATQTWMFPKGAPKRSLFKDIAGAVYPEHIGMYRYDKRASGKSGGVYKDTDMDRLAKDLMAVAEQAKKQFPDSKIVLLGQSEGASTALRACQLGLKPDLLVLQGPSLEPLEVFLVHQKTRAAAPFLKGDPELSDRYPYLTAFYQAMYQGDMLDKIQNTNDKYYTLRLGNWSAITNLNKYRQYRWNGLETLKEISIPVAVIYGSEDGNVRPEAGRIILSGQEQGMYRNVDVKILPGLEHSFRSVVPGDDMFTIMGKPLNPTYLVALKQWLNEHLPANGSRRR